MRGKVVLLSAIRSSRRITPACAGKSRNDSRPHCSGRDHPRVCGEKLDDACKSLAFQGSPPRVRGKGHSRCASSPGWRITPACAGKSDRRPPSPNDGRGSPPRVRGKVLEEEQRHRRHGITPACAGKRCLPPLIIAIAWDHPRVCGEKFIRQVLQSFNPGSPPRVRGKVFHHHPGHRTVGITPACAGKSGLYTYEMPLTQDHPRVCGEKLIVTLRVIR